MTAKYNFGDGIKNLTAYMKYLAPLNPQWTDLAIAEQLIHASNDEAIVWYKTHSRPSSSSSSSSATKSKSVKDESGKVKDCNVNDANIEGNLDDKENEDYTNIGNAEKKTHNRNESYPFSIDTNDNFGRYLSSTRDIKAGEVILMEIPLARGPIFREPRTNVKSSCIHCYQEANSYLCPKCGFYLCRGNDCKVLHCYQDECVILSRLNLTEEQNHIHKMENKNFGEMLTCLPEEDKRASLRMIARAYLSFIRDEKPKIIKFYPAIATFKTLCVMSRSKRMHALVSSLQGEIYPSSSRYVVNQNAIVNTILKLGLPYNEHFIHRIANIWDTNAFEMVPNGVPLQAIFAIASLFTHCCIPNCEHLFTATGVIVVRAIEDISKDTVLTLSYTDLMWPTYIRKDHLLVTKNFVCTCYRCRDPSEFETVLGHVKCEYCGHTSVCTSHGKDLSPEITCSQCSSQIYMKEFFKTEASACRLFANNFPKTLEEFENFMMELEKKFENRYHSNHYFVHRQRIQLLMKNASTDLSVFSNEDLEKMEDIANTVYGCARKIFSTLSQIRARIARELIRIRQEICLRRGKLIEDDEELKPIIEDTSLVLHWEPKLPQLTI